MKKVMIGKYQLHFGEEPCISGTAGSGAVFFCGCDLQCVFCQNAPISRHGKGSLTGTDRLAEIFRELEEKGAHNINLVTGDIWADGIVEALEIYRPGIPVVWNCSGYESPELLKKLEPYVDVYLPDMKYADPLLAARFCRKEDYPRVAMSAVREMIRQKGMPRLDEKGIIRKGVIIRHLVLPLHLKNTEAVLRLLKEELGNVWISLMLQFTPVEYDPVNRELNRVLTERECEKAERLLSESGFTEGYIQDRSSATVELIPKWGQEGE